MASRDHHHQRYRLSAPPSVHPFAASSTAAPGDVQSVPRVHRVDRAMWSAADSNWATQRWGSGIGCGWGGDAIQTLRAVLWDFCLRRGDVISAQFKNGRHGSCITGRHLISEMWSYRRIMGGSIPLVGCILILCCSHTSHRSHLWSQHGDIF